MRQLNWTILPYLLIPALCFVLLFTVITLNDGENSSPLTDADLLNAGLLNDTDNSYEEVDMKELDYGEPDGLPDGYIWTMELLRNKLRVDKGIEVNILTNEDLREGYGRFKIPTKAEIQKQISVGKNKE